MVPLVIGAALSGGFAGTAYAGLIWSNGSAQSVSTNCDSSPDVCNGPNGNSGWTVYDNFEIDAASTITGFTFDSDFVAGDASDYLSTNWSIWEVDPLNLFGFPATATGNATATLATDSSGLVTVTSFTVTGLSLDLTAADTYWLGYNNVLANDGAKTVAVLSNGADLPGYEQGSNDGNTNDQFQESGNTVFSVQGTVDTDGGSGAPEPGSWMPAACGLACLGKWRARLRFALLG
jgi:hypothetical protein